MIDLGLPEIISDVALRSHGLILISGTKGSGRTFAAKYLLSKINREKSSKVAIVSHEASYILAPQKSQFLRFSAKKEDLIDFQNQKDEILKFADVVIVDSVDRHSNIEELIDFAESGLMVIGVTYGLSTSNVFERLLCSKNEYYKKQISKRLSQVFQLSLNMRSFDSLDQSHCFAIETILGVPQIKEIIRDGNFDMISDYVLEQTDSAGLKTLNQALIQLLIRRKIDLKKAFESSAYPEQLDRLLQKVGI